MAVNINTYYRIYDAIDCQQMTGPALTAARLVASAAVHNPEQPPIAWHHYALSTAGTDPSAENFRAMQAASFIAKSELEVSE